MIHFTECWTENVFTWQNPETQAELVFAIDRLPEWCAKTEQQIFDTPVEQDFARMFCRDRGIERHRLDRLTPECFNTPVIYCNMDDKNGTPSQLLVDGHHRYVYAAITGHKWIPAYILTQEQWEPFLVTGLPEQGVDKLRNGFSGIF